MLLRTLISSTPVSLTLLRRPYISMAAYFQDLVTTSLPVAALPSVGMENGRMENGRMRE